MCAGGEVVELLEVDAVGDGELAGAPEVFECGFGRFPVPPPPPAAGLGFASGRPGGIEVAGEEGAVAVDSGEHGGDGGVGVFAEAAEVPATGLKLLEAAVPVWEELGWDEGGVVGPMFEKLA